MVYKTSSIGVVIPAFNEVSLLPVTLGKLPHFVDGVIVVDDASNDGTSEAVEAMNDARVDVIKHPQNLGVGRAITTGYEAALTKDYDIVVVMGADDQMDPEEIPTLIDPIVSGEADYVKGNRLGHPEHKQIMPAIRRIGTQVLSYLTRLATGLQGLQDSQCGFTAVSHATLSELPLRRLFPRYGYPNDLLSMLAIQQCRVMDVTVTPIYGSERSGLQVHKVWFPICGILLRALYRRLRTLPMLTTKASVNRPSPRT